MKNRPIKIVGAAVPVAGCLGGTALFLGSNNTDAVGSNNADASVQLSHRIASMPAVQASETMLSSLQYENTTAECMRSAGHQYTIQFGIEQFDEAEAAGESFSAEDIAAISQAGKEANTLNNSFAAADSAWDDTRWECIEQQNQATSVRVAARQQALADAALSEMEHNNVVATTNSTHNAISNPADGVYPDAFHEYVATHPDVVAAKNQWAQCITRAGFPARSPSEFEQKYSLEGTEIPVDLPIDKQTEIETEAYAADEACRVELTKVEGQVVADLSHKAGIER